MTGARVFVTIDGKAWQQMRCESCGVAFDDVNGKLNQMQHPAPPRKPFFWSDSKYEKVRYCPNAGKVFEFPCAIEVK